jgi:AsmA protein
VPTREFNLKGVASLTSNGTTSFELPFVVEGPWDDPLIYPDPESLIRRSPATAPLLDAVKDKKARDTVRSVLERFTGGAARPAQPDTAVPAPTPAPAAAEAAKSN